ncbi:MAG: helix-turn-helix transcriptional regulator [Clostridiales bacterium]|nr:helix-turn-helix transcriptional regulator [Clostridiales bacterium]
MKSKDFNGKKNIVGNNLKKYREQKGLSQRDVCKKLELLGLQIYNSDIHYMEHGEKPIKDYESKALSIVLGISLEQMYEDTDKDFE